MSTNRIHAGVTSLLLVAAAACGGAEGNEGTDDSAQFAQPSLVSVGTELRVQLAEELSTSENRTGETFGAAVVSPVQQDGIVLIPAGAHVTGRVTGVQEAEGERPAVLKVDFTQIEVHGETYPLAASVVEAHPESRSTTSTGEDVAKVGAGTAAGAIVGRIIGGDATGTLVGAAVGAAAGTAIVLGTQDVEAVLPEGSIVTLRLDESLEIEPAETD